MTGTVRVQSRLWRVYRRMNLAALTEEEDGEGDPLGLASRDGRTRLAWETYSRGGLEHAVRAYGTLERLEARGLGKLALSLDLADPFTPTITVRSDLFVPPLLKASLRQTNGRQLGLLGPVAEVPLLFLESLLLQNPGKRFDWQRPPLPGQEFPGLSLSAEVIQLLLLMAKRVGAEGMALRPSSFHAAWIYARHFLFVDGRAQGRFEGLRSESRLRPLWLLSWALELGCVRSGGERVAWTPDLMIAPLDARVARAVNTVRRRAALRQSGRAEYRFDRSCLRRRFPWERMPPPPVPQSLQEMLRAPAPDV
ncbi:MAG TPA: deacetylase [Myxococcaceae bacterium]|nr:deacetylase [Myxococcaceae bacterium]